MEVIEAEKARQESEDRQKQAKEAKRQARLEEHKTHLRAAMARHPTGETKTVLRNEAGLNGKTVGPALSALLKDGEAASCKIEKNGRVEEAYKLAGS